MQIFWVAFALAALTAVVAATLVASAIGRFGFPVPLSERRLGNVDGLRGYLALAVVFHHFYVWIELSRLGGAWKPITINFLNQLGAGSVGLFFMATGLVFYPKILKGLKENAWPSIFLLRFFRIVPLVVFSFIIVSAVIEFRATVAPDFHYVARAMKWVSAYDEPDLLGYSNSRRVNAKVLWSLWYEWLFYLTILPISAGLMSVTRRNRLPTCIVPIALFITGFGAQFVSYLLDRQVSVLFYLPLFASGMLAYEIRARLWLSSHLQKPWVGGLAVISLLAGMLTTNTPYSASLPLFAFFFVCITCGNDLGGLLRSRGAIVLGECSFGIYLLHGVLLSVIFNDAGAALNPISTDKLPYLLPIITMLTVFIAATTYLLIEKPMIKLGRFLTHRMLDHRSEATARTLSTIP